jgi:tRNA(Ile2) C34 agmatinyltransferase TiaS
MGGLKMKMNTRCGACGATVPNKGKFHRCLCGAEFSRAKLSDTWKVSRLTNADRQAVVEYANQDIDREQSRLLAETRIAKGW